MQSERLRIARELHDTVAHAVSVMVLHAGAVRSRLPADFCVEIEALGQAEDAGRQAIVELRRMLGMLRGDDRAPGVEPQPTLHEVDRLLDDARGDGLSVDLCVEGEARLLEPAVEVSAYRILQEALTNVRKHARASAVTVHIAYDEASLHLRICDDGVGIDRDRRDRPGSAGYGLAGIRERVEVYGGRLSLSTPRAGGCAVDVVLPVVDRR